MRQFFSTAEHYKTLKNPNIAGSSAPCFIDGTYRREPLHDAFGGVTHTADLSKIMKSLISLKRR